MRTGMTTAATAAEPISAEEQAVKNYNNKLWKLYTGEEKFDLSKMPNAAPLMSMYQGAKATGDRNRIGKGLQYGGGAGGGYNPNLIASIDAQNQDERERDAAGALEQRVADTFGGLEGKMMGLGQSDSDRRNENWSRYNEMYKTEVNKPKKPKWWESLLGGAAQVGAGWASSGFAT